MRWVVSIFLAGCSILPIREGASRDVHKTVNLRLVTIRDPYCTEVFNRSIRYLHSEGIGVKESGDVVDVVCVRAPMLHNAIPVLGIGEHQQRIALVAMTGAIEADTKTMLHEICHAAWNCPHEWSGIMAPIGELMAFASGYGEKTLAFIKGELK